MNRIAEIKTLMVDGPDGQLPVIMAALDVDDASQAGEFVAGVVEQIKLARMTSPPETAHLLVTVIGDLSAESFAELWHQSVALDQVMKTLMTQMVVADVLQGSASGEVLGQSSLLNAVPDAV